MSGTRPGHRRERTRGRAWRWLTLAGLLAALGGTLAPPATSAAQQGRLTIRIAGLPRGERPQAVLRGPQLQLRVRRAVVHLRARPGRYVLALRRVRIRRTTGPIRRGALATASRRRVVVRLRPGRRATLHGVYTTIVNPGLVRGRPRVLDVAGPPGNPTAIVLAGRRSFQAGAILSIPPGGPLPRGLLSHVEAARFAHGRTRVTVRAASIYEVAPALEFDVPLHPTPGAHAGAASCGGVSGLSPYRRISNISMSGGWNSKRILGHDIHVGVRAQVHFDVSAGLDVTGGIGVSCSARASVSASGMAGPIPVTAAIEGELSAFAGAGGRLSTGGSLHVDAGAETIGLPPAMAWSPQVSFSRPHFSFTAQRFAEARASIGVGVKAGLGNDAIASATLKVGATTELSAKPGACSWDARFGQFSAEGKLLGWTIETPRTPALFTKSLWHAACGQSGGGSPGPSPKPAPRPPSGSGTLVHLTALGPTSGPGGLAVDVAIPACSGSLYVQSGALVYGIQSTAGLTHTPLPTATPDAALGAGAHDLSVTCRNAHGVGVWHDPAVHVTLTSAPQPVVVSPTSLTPGATLSFQSGPSLSPRPCPAWPGRTVESLVLAAYLPGSAGATHSATGVAMPDGQASEPLVVSGAAGPGRYIAQASCSYTDGARSDSVDFRPTWVTMSS